MSADLWWRIDQAVKTAIEGAGVSGLNNVASQLYPDVQALAEASFPAAVISEEDMVPRLIQRSAGGSGYEQWSYPVRVWMVDVEPAHASKELYLTLLRTLAGLFAGKRLTGVNEVQWCDVDYAVTFNPELPRYRHCVSGMVLWFRCSEARS